MTVCADRDGQRVDNFLARELKGLPKTAIYRLIRTGQVRINGGRCKPDRRVAEGDEVRIPPLRLGADGGATVSAEVEQQLRQSVLYEDADYLVLDKPSGMAVHPGSGLAWGLIEGVRQGRPGEYLELAHRLDRETSGCLVLARNGPALQHFQGLLRAGEVSKKYLCLMQGRLPQPLLVVDAPLQRAEEAAEHTVEVSSGGRQAVTTFRRLQGFANATYVEAELHTGRTHQIRAHAAHLGLPLAGDARYGSAQALRQWQALGLKRLFLHAHLLSFPTTDGEALTISSPLPDDLRQLLQRLEGAPATA